MCGLYSLRKSEDEVRAAFGSGGEALLGPRDYVTPSGPMAIVRLEPRGLRLAWARWGLVPAWVKEVVPGKPLINARAETALDKPSFRNAMRRRRCLVPADGYYEWSGDVPGRKQAWHVTRPDGGLFALAGIWENWMGSDGSELESACILTTRASNAIAAIHHRMPALVRPEHYALWLDSDNVGAQEAAALVVPAPEDHFVVRETVIDRRSPPPRPEPAVADERQLKLL